MADQYRTIVGIAHAKHVVKKSRFFGAATSVHSREAVKAFLAHAQERRPHASHYCYAYSIGSAETLREYATDAGEPTHSAGPPILSAIRALELCNTLCVVTHYYGGIKLGVGGLIRAYRNCARDCLQNATIETRIFYEKLKLKVHYSNIGTVVTLCKRLGGHVINIEYAPDPSIELRIRQNALETFQSQLQGIGLPIIG